MYCYQERSLDYGVVSNVLLSHTKPGLHKVASNVMLSSTKPGVHRVASNVKLSGTKPRLWSCQ